MAAADLQAKERKLRKFLARLGRVIVAFSGGTDSSLLLYMALQVLGRERVLAVTAVSPVHPSAERARAKAFCARYGAAHRVIETDPFAVPAFRRNGPERCYHCKKHLLETLGRMARKEGFDAILEASQKDDESDFRPGAKAVAESGVLSPLKEAGFGKADVRRLSRRFGLPSADLPAAACLASRVPYGTALTPELAARIDRAESAVRSLGFLQFRVRHHGDLARLEFAPDAMDKAFRFRRSLASRLLALGWKYVCLDLQGYRQGSLNRALDASTLNSFQARKS